MAFHSIGSRRELVSGVWNVGVSVSSSFDIWEVWSPERAGGRYGLRRELKGGVVSGENCIVALVFGRFIMISSNVTVTISV